MQKIFWPFQKAGQWAKEAIPSDPITNLENRTNAKKGEGNIKHAYNTLVPTTCQVDIIVKEICQPFLMHLEKKIKEKSNKYKFVIINFTDDDGTFSKPL